MEIERRFLASKAGQNYPANNFLASRLETNLESDGSLFRSCSEIENKFKERKPHDFGESNLDPSISFEVRMF